MPSDIHHRPLVGEIPNPLDTFSLTFQTEIPSKMMAKPRYAQFKNHKDLSSFCFSFWVVELSISSIISTFLLAFKTSFDSSFRSE